MTSTYYNRQQTPEDAELASYKAKAEMAEQQRRAAEAERDAINARLSARPQLTAWDSQIDPSTGRLRSQLSSLPGLEGKLSGINLDKRGLEAYRERALQKGPSAWQRLQEQNLGLQEQEARQKAAAQAAQGMAQGRASLATRGGLSSGARERMARAGGIGMLQAQQEISRGGMTNRLNLATEDEKMRQAALQNLPGMEIAALGPEMEKAKMWGQAQEFDIANSLKEYQAKRQRDMEEYQERQKAYAAEQQAQAERNRDSGGCWICTEVNEKHPLTEDEKKCLFKFKKFVLKHHREPGRFYLKDCKELTKRMKAAGVNWSEWVGFDRAIVTLIRADLLRAAYVLYRNTVLDLVALYWPDCNTRGFRATRDEYVEQTHDYIDDEEAPVLSEEDQHLLERLL